jgi:DTW domain-containing protein YfiP
MSTISGSQDCHECGGKDTLCTCYSNKPYDSSSGICLNCGFTYGTVERQATLDEVNEERER